ncbi:MAG: hypothetical protein MJZ05_10160 [Fibrobacter sp.]|nr:hypothetical protein [Fibrobacter sp.]
MPKENLLDKVIRSQCSSIWTPNVLDKIAKRRNLIKRSSERWGIDPMAAASVMFQEKYYGFFADAKNALGAYKLMIGDDSYSFGPMEMQVKTAMRLLKVRGERGTRSQAISWLSHEPLAIDLAVQYLRELQNNLPSAGPTDLAKAYNLGLENALAGKRSYIGQRSESCQEEIEHALYR